MQVSGRGFDNAGKVALASWRPFAKAAALAIGLCLSSTAVLGYADLLPQGFDFGMFEEADAAATLPGALPNVARQIALDEPLRIVAFGSSSTEGIGASRPSAAYPARLEVALENALPALADGIEVINRGIGGEMVDDMLARLDRDVIALKPQLVIWQTGSNDPLRGVSLDHFHAATLAGVQRIRAAGIDVILMEPQWCPKLDATAGAYRFRDAVRAIGDELGVAVIRRSDLMKDWIARNQLTRTELFSADGLHMADKGYQLLAEAAAGDVLRGAAAVTMADASPAE